MRYFYLLLFWVLAGPVAAQFATPNAATILQGQVRVAETSAPLPGAQLELIELGLRATSGKAGDYVFQLPATPLLQLTLRATYAGKQDVEVPVKLAAATTTTRDVQLRNRSLTLAEVEVNAQRSGQQISNSAVVIGREAIEQTQAYSLGDVLQLLPGKTITNPNLQGAQGITLRTSPVLGANATNQQRAFLQNNAFGTAIIVDGATWGNNGNLQARDPGRFGLIGGEGVPAGQSGTQYESGSYAGSSLDLKQIPANNIESVEIIQGVPSARYGDLSTGAIIVNRQAGRTPYRVGVRTQSGTTEVNAAKGIGLKNGDALNLSVTYLNSNPQPQFKEKIFNRVTLSTIYTNYFGPQRRHRNSLSVDMHSTLDDGKTDPDSRNTVRTYSKDQRVALANRGTLNLTKAWSEYVTYQFGASYSYQQAYHFNALNTQTRPVNNAMTTGINRGSFTPNVYDAEYSTIGRPFNAYARADNTVLWVTGAWSHTLTTGASVNYDQNYGAGRLSDPLRPRFGATGGKAERPYDFRSVPGLLQAGAFLENQVVREWGPRKLIANLGLRYDLQNGFSTLAPRLNAKLLLREGVQLNAAYGLSAKAPGLVHRYPGPLYFDVPLLNSFNGRENESVYLVHTEVLNPANPNLRPARARTLEVGFNLASPKGYGLSVTGFRKQDFDGFNVNSRLLQLTLPDFAITGRTANNEPIIAPTGTSRRYGYSYGVVENNLRTDNYGLELQLRTPKLRVIQTSFDLTSTYTDSRNYRLGQVTYERQNTNAVGYEDKEFTLRVDPDQKGRSAVSTLSSSTHLARLGLVVTVRGQMFWGNWSRNLSPFIYAQGYYRPDGTYVAITPEEYATGAFDYLRRAQDPELLTQPMVYGVAHLRLAKELGKLCRLSFFANNFLNLRPEYYNEVTNSLRVYNQQPVFGSEVVLTF